MLNKYEKKIIKYTLIIVMAISLFAGFLIRDFIDGANVFGWVIIKEIELDADAFKNQKEKSYTIEVSQCLKK